MTILRRCQRYLKQHGIRYAHSIHAPAYTAREVASAERMPVYAMAKTLVYRGDLGFGMLVLPADRVADLREVSRLLGLRDIRLATEAELAALFPECDLGAMPPLANLFDMPLLMDERLAISDFMAFNAGTHRDVIHLSVADFHRLVNPLVASFALPEAAAIAWESNA